MLRQSPRPGDLQREEEDGDVPETRGGRTGAGGELAAHGEQKMGGEAPSRADRSVRAAAVGGGREPSGWVGGWVGAGAVSCPRWGVGSGHPGAVG